MTTEATVFAFPHLCKYLKVTANSLLTSLEHTHNVELLSKIQLLTQELSLEWDNGLPKYEEKKVNARCGCPHTQAKQELLTLLLNEYNTRMYQPEDTRRMHLSERSL